MEVSTIANLVILGTLLVFTIIGLIKGLFKSIISVVVIALAIVIGMYASTPLSYPVANWLAPRLEDKVVSLIKEKFLPEGTDASVLESVTELLEDAKALGSLTEIDTQKADTDPEYRAQIDALLGEYNLEYEDIESFIEAYQKYVSANVEKLTDSSKGSADTIKTEDSETESSETQAKADNALSAAVQPAVRGILWFLIAIVSYILLSLVSGLINKAINKTPVLGFTNRLLGAALGLLTGAAVIYIIAYVIAGIGAAEAYGEFLGGSSAYEAVMKLIPKDAFGKFSVVEIPVLGELNIGELLGF